MKRSSGEQKQLIPIGATDSSHMQVAVPDTTIDPGTLPQVSDTVQPSQLPDTILGKDKRDPYEAGYDDGYAAGCDDGAAHTEKPIMMKPTTLPPLPKNKTMFVAIVRAIHRATKTDEMANNSIFK